MFVENTQARAVYCGGILLYPGINRVTDAQKADLEKNGYWAGLEELVEYGDIKFHEEKLSAAVVAKTYNIQLLESWMDEAPRPVRNAIEKQLKEMKKVPEGSQTITIS